MIDEPDFSIEGEDSPPVEQPAATPPPKVVIEYRDRGFPSLLIPPLLILVAVLVILDFRRETPILVPLQRRRKRQRWSNRSLNAPLRQNR